MMVAATVAAATKQKIKAELITKKTVETAVEPVEMGRAHFEGGGYGGGGGRSGGGGVRSPYGGGGQRSGGGGGRGQGGGYGGDNY